MKKAIVYVGSVIVLGAITLGHHPHQATEFKNVTVQAGDTVASIIANNRPHDNYMSVLADTLIVVGDKTYKAEDFNNQNLQPGDVVEVPVN